VPFRQIGLDLCCAANAGQHSRPLGAARGAGQDVIEPNRCKQRFKSADFVLAACGEPQVVAAGVVPRERPSIPPWRMR
ncbi:MAG: hypothetical protein M3Y22_17260, partial [Pseudomonadota bacterium]|nr:hypothetical protein [Pseudomonadota bacterium]